MLLSDFSALSLFHVMSSPIDCFRNAIIRRFADLFIYSIYLLIWGRFFILFLFIVGNSFTPLLVEICKTYLRLNQKGLTSISN